MSSPSVHANQVKPLPEEPANDRDYRPLSPLPPGWRSLQRVFVQSGRAHWKKAALADSTGMSLTYGQTLLGACALSRVLSRKMDRERYVGILIPPTVPGALVNISVALLGRVPVNLNYTASQELVDASLKQCGITHVVTSRRVLERFGIRPTATLLDIEDLKKEVGLADKIFAAAAARVLPLGVLGALLPGLRHDGLDDTATVIFTSGSTGDPKGVVLSNRNILSNVHQIQEHVRLSPSEVVVGVLPFFHSFGFTATLWTVLCLGLKAAYHYSPLDARTIGKLSSDHKATVLFGTQTFVRGYLRKCGPEQFAGIRLPILGAEKLKREVAAEIERGLGIQPLEGYGCTETGPVVAVNTPDPITLADGRTVPGNRPGAVGLPVPGTRVRTHDPDTRDVLPRGAEGIVEVSGPQVMSGYLNKPEATAKALRDGWYSTGDLGHVDEDGFLHITGRLARFSKIGGEMVPHEKVESAIAEIATSDGGDTLPHVAVTSLPDHKRGERLVVLHTALPIAAGEICRKLASSDLPRLWIPAPSDFVEVEALPILGTGKLDLRRMRELAESRLGGDA